MAFNPCTCGCIPANIDEVLFRQMAINVLCQISSNTSGDSGNVDNINVSQVGGAAITSSGVPTVLSASSVLKTTQVRIAVTGTAVQFPSNVLVNGVIIRANTGNSAQVVIGPAGVNNTQDGTGNGHILGAGESTSSAVPNTNTIYLNGTAGDWVSFIGS